MNDPETQGDPKTGKKRRPSRRIRAISIAPSLVTLGNLLCGFTAVYFSAREYTIVNPSLQHWLPTNLALACYLIFAAMICDALDGRLARLSRATSDFGGQLDSLADVVSFGVAPAFIAIRLMREILHESGAAGVALVSPAGETMFGRFCWMAGAAYVACTAMRLARFNVENDHDESAHMGFKGLPSPGAAGALISVILLNKEVLPEISPMLAKFSQVTALAVPFVTLALGLLMVSRIPYTHMVNRYFRGRKPFWMLVAMLFFVLAFLSWPQLVLVVGMCGFAASGPITYVFHRLRHPEHVAAPTENLPSSSSSTPKE